MLSKIRTPLIVTIGCVAIYFIVLLFQSYNPFPLNKNQEKELLGCEKLGKQAKELCIDRIHAMSEQSKKTTEIKD
ncbi:hypothetical protein [Piscirickettsia litoralis]|uniref:Uncharacterized protein n=1 Tax=Piscirickettsia litoralis TaxID=1891921 RepID=A0ABX2ZZF3_9GAMM|nr:hypothetical protein [Piscirickettsia litoralis]ODN41966.1 hypothetical protein BGC07_02065 [Piscirickettsia litoralis]